MLNINELTLSACGKLINGDSLYVPKNYVTDSRIVKDGDFFIPIIGENVDGHKFILDSVKNGISGYFISSLFEDKDFVIEESIKINKDIIIIEVKDTAEALRSAARYNREKHINIPVIAVTGSVGKTSTREIIASVLMTEKKVLVTEKNYNSLIGLPIMCLKISDDIDVCVLEAGIDKFGEMEKLSEILKPDIACFTLIGMSHIGTFKTRDNIFTEKFKVTNFLKGMKTLVINSDDDKLCTISDNKFNILKISEKDILNIDIKDGITTFDTKIYDRNEHILLNQIGNHNAQNALFAIKIGELFNISARNIKAGISNYKNFDNRLNLEVIDGIKIINDAYNASLESIKSGIETIKSIASKSKLAVLGDVFDLGDLSTNTHIEIGKYLSENSKSIDTFLLCGNAMKYAYDVLEKNNVNSKYFSTNSELLDYLTKNYKNYDLIYFKASNGMKFIDLVNDFKNYIK